MNKKGLKTLNGNKLSKSGLENILKDINVANNNLTREIKDTDKIHLENLKPNEFENVVNQFTNIFQLVISQIK